MTRETLLDHAIAILRRGVTLTLDSLARETGLTKAGVMHHVGSKEGLMRAVLDHIVDGWETELNARVADPTDAASRLRAYVDHAFTGSFDQSDLALLADVRLRERLREQWNGRLAPWLGPTKGATPAQIAARLLADGAWLNQSLGTVSLTGPERERIRELALGLLDEGDAA